MLYLFAFLSLLVPLSQCSPPIEVTYLTQTSTSDVLLQTTVTRTSTTTIVPSKPPIVAWSQPTSLPNLGSFGVVNYADGKQNLAIVTGIPASASALPTSITTPTSLLSSDHASSTSLKSNNTSTHTALPSQGAPPTWSNTSAVLQLFYPSGSINPGSKPVGGADFYALPPPLSSKIKNASTVTLSYSVFFPIDFDWVLAGKLPGLYGGHQGCSGGDDASDCFSTRMMWRQDGAGELYLYAPRDLQDPSLCKTPPQSVCSSTYGLSIGRGSFHFTRGAWTHVSQTITLNTPGIPNGRFTISINGVQILSSNKVLYRDDPNATEGKANNDAAVWSDTLYRSPLVESYPIRLEVPPASNENSGLLGSVVAILGLDLDPPSSSSSSSPSSSPSSSKPTHTTSKSKPSSTSKTPSTPTPKVPITFSGLFFSTFFGGHESEYATPKDQYTWFKDFAISIDA
ncbi:hypothetical protein SISSUDRAFT_1048759 [Sistotremastrum suecicum HHB10207 ss-3]|uniref:Polysaccharide lyase 14 domain-containing protein n=1 Tax=Sistotremastrum suecicum HHB10207 ss-3 TaxID=1314776 RepID=A0A166C9E0_9AGAM|nr:hypothetical protein SISSUDRAFT_1048759 [Sistotremastrum suecicum HHB10207 ss-3]